MPDRAPAARIALHGLVVLVAAAGCYRPPPSFAPVEAGPESVPSIIASYYDIRVDDHVYGDVKVWSPGAFAAGKQEQRPVLDMIVRIRNDFAEAVTLEVGRLELELVNRRRELFVQRQPTVVGGQPTVAPGTTERVTLRFPLPAELEPDDVIGFELTWSVRTPVGLYARSTPFMREPKSSHDYFDWYRPLYVYGNYWWPGPFWPVPGWWGYPAP